MHAATRPHGLFFALAALALGWAALLASSSACAGMTGKSFRAMSFPRKRESSFWSTHWQFALMMFPGGRGDLAACRGLSTRCYSRFVRTCTGAAQDLRGGTLQVRHHLLGQQFQML